MQRLGLILVSVWVWILWGILIFLWTPVIFLLFLATAWWDPRRIIVGRVFRHIAAAATDVNPLWRVGVRGHPPRDTSGPHVVVCNHESLADVAILAGLLGDMKWLSKNSIFRIPLLGQMMRMAGDVPVRRRNPESRLRAYERLKQWLHRGVSVMIFPEGTRSPTREMLPFRNGAFRLAIETGKPVLPMAVTGTREAIRKGSLLFGRARARVEILEPVPVEGLGPGQEEALRDRIRETIRDARGRLRADLMTAERT